MSIIAEKSAAKNTECLTAKQYVAISLLVTGVSKATVAKKLGVNPSTISKWLSEPTFIKVYEVQKAKVLEETTNQLIEDIAAQRQMVDKAILKNIALMMEKLDSKTSIKDHREVIEVLDQSLKVLGLSYQR